MNCLLGFVLVDRELFCVVRSQDGPVPRATHQVAQSLLSTCQQILRMPIRKTYVAVFYALLFIQPARSAPPAWGIAATPPLGFNSWDYFGCSVNETILQAAAKMMHSSGLAAAGYRYVNSDDCWMMRERNAEGQQVPNPAKFPSGIEATIALCHGLNLSFGLYTSRSNFTCGGYAASCGHEEIDASTWAQWGVDYMKDDSCGPCRATLTDYGIMQAALWSAGRPMVLSVEGQPDITAMSAGGYGNLRRVGHDITPRWRSMASLVDIGSGLWPYAHNASNATSGGFWNDLDMDLDMVEIGNAPDFVCSAGTDAWARCVAHLTLWAVMKAPILLGGDLSLLDTPTLNLLTNTDVLDVNQDSLGVQARRVAVTRPANMSLVANGIDGVAVLSRCSNSTPTQLWHWRNASAGPPTNLFVWPCDPTDAFQRWLFVGGSGSVKSPLVNFGSGECAVAAGMVSPGLMAPCNGSTSQAWLLQNGTAHVLSGNGSSVLCLDVFDGTGPAIDAWTCKQPGNNDANQQWTWNTTSGQLSAASTPGMCLRAASGALSTPLYSFDEAGTAWCLESQGGGESDWVPVLCNSTPAGVRDFTPIAVPGAPDVLQIVGVHSPVWNNDEGASGPTPHSRYISGWVGNGGEFVGNISALINGDGSTLRANADDIIDDDLIGGVFVGGDFCLDFTAPGWLEAWAGPLSGNRTVVALFNRSPMEDTVPVSWQAFNSSVDAAFDVYDVWEGANKGRHVGGYASIVAAHGAALLLLTPATGSESSTTA